VKTAVQHWVKTLTADFDGIQKFVPWYDMSQFGWPLCQEIAKSM
jgi:hypothetical protein